MTNPTLELILRHASIRRYKPDPVPVSVTEAASRGRLAGLADNQAFIR